MRAGVGTVSRQCGAVLFDDRKLALLQSRKSLQEHRHERLYVSDVIAPRAQEHESDVVLREILLKLDAFVGRDENVELAIDPKEKLTVFVAVQSDVWNGEYRPGIAQTTLQTSRHALIEQNAQP